MTHRFSSTENSFSIGSSHALDPQTMVKTRFSGNGKIAMLCQREWRPKSLITLSAEYDSKANNVAPKLGLALALKPWELKQLFWSCWGNSNLTTFDYCPFLFQTLKRVLYLPSFLFLKIKNYSWCKDDELFWTSSGGEIGPIFGGGRRKKRRKICIWYFTFCIFPGVGTRKGVEIFLQNVCRSENLFRVGSGAQRRVGILCQVI